MSEINTIIKSIIKSPISSNIEPSVDQALIRLNDKYHVKGEPDVVTYFDNEKINAVFSIGVRNGYGKNSYKIISVRECNMIWGILTTLPQQIKEGQEYLYKDSEGNWFLVNSKTKTPLSSLPPRTYIDLSTGETYLTRDGIVRKIGDFFSRSEIDNIVSDQVGEISQANWTNDNPLSNSFIKNKPTSFSDFEDDIEYSFKRIDATPGFNSSYALVCNGEIVGDVIDIPNDYVLKSGNVSSVSQEDKQPGGKFYNNPAFLVNDPYLNLVEYNGVEEKNIYIPLKDLASIYTYGKGINITKDSTIEADILFGNGLEMTEDNRLRINNVNRSNNGAMLPADVQKLNSLDLENIATKENLLSGEIEVYSKTSKNIISPSNETIEIRSEGFSFRSTAGEESVGIGNAILKKLGGTKDNFTPISLKTNSSNNIKPGNKLNNARLNEDKSISISSLTGYSIYWFPCIKGEASPSVFDLKNNGYAITSGDEPIGYVGFTTIEPTYNGIRVDEIIKPVTTPYSNKLIHYLPPDNGWLLVSVKNEVQDKLCARLSWSGAFDIVYEVPEEYELQLPGTALGRTIHGDTVEDYWYDNNGQLYFHKAYGMITMDETKWGDPISSTGGHDPNCLIVNYRGSENKPTKLLSDSLTKLPEVMWVDGVEKTVSREFNFNDDSVHEVKYRFGNGMEFPNKIFMGLSDITSVILPLSCKILNLNSFKDCTNLVTVTLSPSTSYIGIGCFQGCTSLTTINVFNPTPATIYNDSFPTNTIFYVPGNYINNYTSDPVWSEFDERLISCRETRYYYRYSGLVGLIKEYTLFTIGLSGTSVTDTGVIEIEVEDDSIKAPEGDLYYELKHKLDIPLNLPSSFKIWDYGTEYFSSGQTSGSCEIIYPVSLYDDVRHSRTMLAEKIEKHDIDTEMSDVSDNPVQNSVLKTYIDTVINESTNICKDLSRIDSFGKPMGTRNTANCYIISKPGKYKIPLIYGNAIKSGKDNKASYTKLDYPTNADFKNMKGDKITTPSIEEDTGFTAVRGEVVWESDNLILNEEVSIVSGSPVNYLAFTINAPIPERGGNAVIAILNENNVIMWSWHLWVIKDSLEPVNIWNNIESSLTSGTEYKIMPLNLGWTWDDFSYQYGTSVYYQWGRKDPIIGPRSYNDREFLTPYRGTVSYMGASTIEDSIKNPNKYFLAGDTTTWCCTLSNFDNYWNANAKDTIWGDIATVKTVYDPCPVGWKVPNSNVFRGFATRLGDDSISANFIGSFDNGYWFKKNHNDTVGVFSQLVVISLYLVFQ